MEILTQAIVALLRADPGASAAFAAKSCADELREEGFEVEREYRVSDRGDGRSGRIDIVASIPHEARIAVEIDYLTPRRKSLYKLRDFPGLRIIVLRHAERGSLARPPWGIHAMLGLGGAAIVHARDR